MVYYTWKSYKLTVDPFAIFKILAQGRHPFFLDSSMKCGSLGRYSFLGCDPFYVAKEKPGEPFDRLRGLLDNYKIATGANFPPFACGAVGYLDYDMGFLLEDKLKKIRRDDLGLPHYILNFYNLLFATDNLKKRLYILAVGFPEKKYRYAKALCESNLKKTVKLLSSLESYSLKAGLGAGNIPPAVLESNFSRPDYLHTVKKAKEYIGKGDIYQINLSQRFQTESRLSALEIYERLRNLSPSCFSAYFDAGDFQILSSSPERFLKLEGDIVTTRPMKGTRPRACDRRTDARLKNNLIHSAKDKAELNMIVDLERNDLGRVCSYGSVKVNRLRQVEKYKTVFQTTSDICGRLHERKDRIDLLRAAFPGGSITGCPKIRAMEIIEELEPSRRSIYTGALGYFSFCGNMDLNILIRTILKKKDRLYFGVGGGIVADSDPQAEYEETLVKARAMVEAINGS